jgi:hypothetical protein
LAKHRSYRGTELNRAARLLALAHGGQVLVWRTPPNHLTLRPTRPAHGLFQCLLEPRSRCRRPEYSECFSTARRLDHQPHLPAYSDPGHVGRTALPVGVGAPTLQAVWSEAQTGVTDDQAAASESPAVAASRSDGEHTMSIGPVVLLL